MNIEKITIIAGKGKDGLPEKVGKIELKMGDIVSIVGPTGCGKTTLINDIELFANNDTPSGRQILINGEPVPADYSLSQILVETLQFYCSYFQFL
jgi:ABC-type lipoprotein export system ATPase subunit